MFGPLIIHFFILKDIGCSCYLLSLCFTNNADNFMQKDIGHSFVLLVGPTSYSGQELPTLKPSSPFTGTTQCFVVNLFIRIICFFVNLFISKVFLCSLGSFAFILKVIISHFDKLHQIYDFHIPKNDL